MIVVDDADDPRLADYRHLKDAAAHRAGAVIVEGVLALRALRASCRAVRSVLLTPQRAATLAADVAGLSAPVYVASREVLAGIAGFDVHRGVLASAERWELPELDTLLAGARRVVVAEGLNDLENLGALFRNAAAFGLDGVVLCPRCADPRSRRAIRVSLGHVLGLPFTRLAPWPAGLATLRAAGFSVVALTPSEDALDLAEAGLGQVERLALLVGAEGPGLTPEARAASDRQVRIPMATGVDSLNVATAAAVAFHAARPTGPR